MKKAIAVAALVCLCAGCSGARPAPARAVLTFGAVPLGDAATRQKQIEALAQYLEKKLAQPVAITVAPDYRAFSQAMAERRFELVLLGPVLYSRAHENGYDALAVAVRGGESVRRGVLVARADRGPATLPELKGKKVAFVDAHSASGFEYAFAYLFTLGLKPGDYQREFFGSHEAAIHAVLDGKADVAATFEGAVTELFGEHQAELKVIGQTDPIPGEVLAARSDTPRLAALREALLGLAAGPDAAAVLQPLRADRLIAPAEGMFEGARAIDLLVTEQAGL